MLHYIIIFSYHLPSETAPINEPIVDEPEFFGGDGRRWEEEKLHTAIFSTGAKDAKVKKWCEGLKIFNPLLCRKQTIWIYCWKTNGLHLLKHFESRVKTRFAFSICFQLKVDLRAF